MQPASHVSLLENKNFLGGNRGEVGHKLVTLVEGVARRVDDESGPGTQRSNPSSRY